MGVKPASDLAPDVLARALPGRPVRTYPALLSTHADALAWAREGGPAGAVVVADYQAAPRGRGGIEWRVEPGRGLGFSLVVRPALPAQREGWLYVACCAGIADVTGPDAAVGWPDLVLRDGAVVARVGISAEPAPGAVGWAVLTVLLETATPPRGPLLAEAVAAIERALADEPDRILAGYRARCATLGRRVRARLVPLGPSGVQITGEAVDAKVDGTLVVRTDRGSRVAIRPQHLGVLEEIG